VKAYYQSILAALPVQGLATTFQDINNSWQVMLIVLAISFVLGFVFLLLIRLAAAIIVWTFILAITVTLVALTYFSFDQYHNFAAYHSDLDDKSVAFLSSQTALQNIKF